MIDPNPGLVHFVESGHLLAPWKEHKAFLKEEADEGRLREQNERSGYKRDSPLDKALHEVFETVGDKDVGYWRGVLFGPVEAVDRLRTRAGMEAGKHSTYAYTDRRGVLRLPFDEALDVARRFSAAEPATVLVAIEGTERKWRAKRRRLVTSISRVSSMSSEHPGHSFDSGLVRMQRWRSGKPRSNGWSVWCGTRFTPCRRLASTARPADYGARLNDNDADLKTSDSWRAVGAPLNSPKPIMPLTMS
jgi:hypothetical protein